MNPIDTLIILGAMCFIGITLSIAIADVEAKIDKLLKEKEDKG